MLFEFWKGGDATEEETKETYEKAIAAIEDAEFKNKPFKSRINNLFLDFDNSLPVEYFTFKTPQIENSLNVIKENIKQRHLEQRNINQELSFLKILTQSGSQIS